MGADSDASRVEGNGWRGEHVGRHRVRRTTVGLRSAGADNGVVFLAGPSVISGINLFAFDSETGSFLGAKNIPQYNNIREWVNVRGALYTGAAYSEVPGNSPGGAVLRWRGWKSSNPAVLFNFEVVGKTHAGERQEVALRRHREPDEAPSGRRLGAPPIEE